MATRKAPAAKAQPVDAAENFIAGFEDDATQEGVEDLLSKIRDEIFRRKTVPTLLCKRPKATRVDYWPMGDYAVVYSKLYEIASFQRHSEKRHIWFGTECIYDQDGSRWERRTGDMIQDDFGQLVVLQGGAA